MSLDRRTLATALVLALGAAVSLGLARFAYALLLPAMRADLGWTYATAGAMNTANAAGYLIGALAMPGCLRRWGPRGALVGGSLWTAALLMAHGAVRSDLALGVLRLACGAGSAAVFVAGGLMAAQLAAKVPAGSRPGPSLVIGLYYGGTGLGIVVCALGWPLLTWAAPELPGLGVPLEGGRSSGLAGWQVGWWALGGLALAATAVMAAGARVPVPPASAQDRPRVPWGPLAPALAGYTCFGLGYIGYMTFVVTLLREQQLGTGVVTVFYALLGASVMASPWLWAGLLQRHRNGRPMALLNGLLAVATLLAVAGPALGAGRGASVALALVSGALFGAVFLSVVGSTTALVRHNLPPAAWPAGITAFTVVFAAGQIAGPVLTGWLADGPGGLSRGFVVSAALLALGSLLAASARGLPLSTPASPVLGDAQSRRPGRDT